MKVEIKDSTCRLLYRNKFKTNDKNAMYLFLQMLEKFSPFSILEIIKDKTTKIPI